MRNLSTCSPLVEVALESSNDDLVETSTFANVTNKNTSRMAGFTVEPRSIGREF